MCARAIESRCSPTTCAHTNTPRTRGWKSRRKEMKIKICFRTPDAGWLAGWCRRLLYSRSAFALLLSFSNRHMPFLLFISLLYFRHFIIYWTKMHGRMNARVRTPDFPFASTAQSSMVRMGNLDANKGAISHQRNAFPDSNPVWKGKKLAIWSERESALAVHTAQFMKTITFEIK